MSVDTALSYLERGWSVIDIPPKQKGPTRKGWQKLRLDAEQIRRRFNGDTNIGVLTGEPSGNLLDVDLDCAEAVAMAPTFLPPTDAVFGRAGKRRSHWLYTSPGFAREAFADPAPPKEMLLELRGTGGQTVFPGSVHPSGEPVEWHEEDDPAEVDPSAIRQAAKWLAAASLIAQAAPDKGRHDYLMDLSGWMVTAEGGSVDLAMRILKPVARAILTDRKASAGPELERMVAGAADLSAKGEPVAGWPRAVEALGEKRARGVATWLGIQEPRMAAAQRQERQKPDPKFLEAIQEMNGRYFVADMAGSIVIGTYQRDLTLGRDRLIFLKRGDLVLKFNHRHYLTGYTQRNLEIWKDLASAWLEHPKRRTYDRVTMSSREHLPADVLNLWRGFGCEARPGDWKTIRKHLKRIVCGGNHGYYDYLKKLLARWVQRPTDHGEVAVVLRGKKGCGKGSVAQIFMRIFRHHALHITQARHLVGNFNSHLTDCCFLFLDEAFWAGDKQGESTLKALVTEPEVQIEPKGVNSFPMPNRLKMMLASNADWVVPASEDERRYFVLDVSSDRRTDRAYFNALHAAIEGGEAEAMLHDLLQVDLSDFDHRTVPHTAALNNQKLISGDGFQKWWMSCLYTGCIVGSDTLADQWPTNPVVKGDLHAAYVQFCLDHGERYPLTVEQFAKRLYEISPMAKERRGPRTVPGRPRGFALPALETCRTEFTTAMNIDTFDWDDDDAEA